MCVELPTTVARFDYGQIIVASIEFRYSVDEIASARVRTHSFIDQMEIWRQIRRTKSKLVAGDFFFFFFFFNVFVFLFALCNCIPSTHCINKNILFIRLKKSHDSIKSSRRNRRKTHEEFHVYILIFFRMKFIPISKELH